MGAHRHWNRSRAVATTATGTAVVALLAGCGDDSFPVAQPSGMPSTTAPTTTPTTTPEATPSTSPSGTAVPASREVVSVYFVLGEKVQPVHHSVPTPAVAGNALRALFAGPTNVGTGSRGTFDVRIPLAVSRDGPATLTADVYAPKDGARQDLVRVPIRVDC